MFNVLTQWQNQLKEANAETEKKARRHAEEVKTISIERLKLSEELAGEKAAHLQTVEVLEKAFLYLKETKSLLTEAQDRHRIAEEQIAKLTQEVEDKNRKIE